MIKLTDATRIKEPLITIYQSTCDTRGPEYEGQVDLDINWKLIKENISKKGDEELLGMIGELSHLIAACSIELKGGLLDGKDCTLHYEH